MTKAQPAQPPETFLIQLTLQEWDMLLAHVNPPGELDHLVPRSPPGVPLVTFQLDAIELDEFMVLFEQTANGAQNPIAMDCLGYAYARVANGLDGQVDPGAHLVRPAAARVGYTELQGQYLAFIYYYQAVHRCSPAESDLQRYFQVTPPTVHSMLKTLQRRRYIVRSAGVARSIELLVPPEAIPALIGVVRP